MQHQLKITVLGSGTSQGIPVIGCRCEVCLSDDPRDKRLRSAILVQYGEHNVVVDAGPDFRQQMLKSGITRLNAILLTHEHKDHITGLDDVRAFNRLSGKAVPVYCERRVSETVKKDFSYAFEGFRYPGLPEFDLRIIDEDSVITIGDLCFMPIRVMHHKLPVFGFRTGKFVYLTDLNGIPDSSYAKLANCDVLVIDALMHKPHVSHYSLEQALEVIEKLKPRRAYLTHISHGLSKHAEVLKMLPENVKPAYDGLEILCG